jgi:DNA-directed RNA polymerase specialized sigma24 family protein
VRLDDPEAFGAFYDHAVPRIYGYFYHRCGGASGIAEELTQETFVTAVTAIRAGRPIAAPLPWLVGIARHKLLDHYRREARTGAGKLLGWPERPVAPSTPVPPLPRGAKEVTGTHGGRGAACGARRPAGRRGSRPSTAPAWTALLQTAARRRPATPTLDRTGARRRAAAWARQCRC